jgi:uncharacterized protein (DUF1501 family)
MERRDFVKAGLMSGSFWMLPSFVKARIPFKLNELGQEKRLLIIQLSGGNDGLNCLVPFRNDLYYKARPSIGINENALLKVNSEFGFNPSLNFFSELFENGELSVYNGVGYPNPNRSHFQSMDTWHSAFASGAKANTGWIGRYLDEKDKVFVTAIELDAYLGLAMIGEMTKGLAIQNLEELIGKVKRLNPIVDDLAVHSNLNNPELSYLYSTYHETAKALNYLQENFKPSQVFGDYPGNEFGQKLKKLASFWCAGAEVPIAFLSLGSFDTHAFQKGIQNNLLNNLDSSLKAFVSDLRLSGLYKDTLIFVFSEFGRRVKENGSKGTDHGAANYAWLISGGLKQPGLLNGLPDLTNLIDGDLACKIDFRSIYQSILNQWLKADSVKILGQSYPTLGFI